MSFVLFVLGLAAVVAGVMSIGFGIPINEFSLGNTLIIAGATGLASGLVVIALAITHRQLKKIADILMSRPGGPGRSSDALEPPPSGGRAGAPRPGLPAGADAPARGSAYSDRPLRNAPMDSAEESDFEPPHLRLPGVARGLGPSSGFEPMEDVPLSPRTQPRIPGIGVPPAAEPKAGQPNWRAPGSRPPAPPVESVRQEPSLGIPQRPAPEAAFDTVWPSDRRAERIDPQPDFAAEPIPPAAAPRLNGDASHRDVPHARPAADDAPVAVLKSGVVDGMAYTLYTDGSIEAELAQGVVRFGSIEELRNHLEKGA